MISISNIAWDVAEDQTVAEFLQAQHITMIDIAPGKYFPNFMEATTADIQKVISFWKSYDISIIGMQSLLFGTSGLNLFSEKTVRDDMQNYLSRVIEIAGEIGPLKLVFGSPKNRDRLTLSDKEVVEISTEFFSDLGHKAQQYGVTVCLEPNPTFYGANFMVTAAETAKIVQEIAHPNIKMQLDFGAISINEENANDICSTYQDLIGHIHLSEKSLKPLGDISERHAEYGQAVREFLPDMPRTIEMVATQDEPHLSAIKRAVTFAQNYYL